jgi:hypothetical protein
MGARPISNGNTLHVPGLYEWIRTRELRLAFAPDPRLRFVKDDPEAYEAALATAPKYSPAVLYQVEELLDRKPVRLPRWLLGGRVTCPEARGWPRMRTGVANGSSWPRTTHRARLKAD